MPLFLDAIAFLLALLLAVLHPHHSAGKHIVFDWWHFWEEKRKRIEVVVKIN